MYRLFNLISYGEQEEIGEYSKPIKTLEEVKKFIRQDINRVKLEDNVKGEIHYVNIDVDGFASAIVNPERTDGKVEYLVFAIPARMVDAISESIEAHQNVIKLSKEEILIGCALEMINPKIAKKVPLEVI